MKKRNPTKTNAKKRAMLSALKTTLGVVTPACVNVGIDRCTHYEWLKTDDEYKRAVLDIENVALDFAESKLHTLIKNNDTTAIIFYLKTRGKGRGYIERSERDITSNGEAINANNKTEVIFRHYD